jgi:hypothetical protein
VRFFERIQEVIRRRPAPGQQDDGLLEGKLSFAIVHLSAYSGKALDERTHLLVLFSNANQSKIELCRAILVVGDIYRSCSRDEFSGQGNRVDLIGVRDPVTALSIVSVIAKDSRDYLLKHSPFFRMRHGDAGMNTSKYDSIVEAMIPCLLLWAHCVCCVSRMLPSKPKISRSHHFLGVTFPYK